MVSKSVHAFGLVVGILLDMGIAFTAVVAQYANTSLDTKGEPFKGVVTDKEGSDIATLTMFGEGTTVIRFNRDGNLVLTNGSGKVVAGYEIHSKDPSRAKCSETFSYRLKDGHHLIFWHEFSSMVFKQGSFNIEGASKTVTTWWEGKEVHLGFVAIKHTRAPGGGTVNKLVLSGTKGQVFSFNIEPVIEDDNELSQMHGDLPHYLKGAAKKQ